MRSNHFDGPCGHRVVGPLSPMGTEMESVVSHNRSLNYRFLLVPDATGKEDNGKAQGKLTWHDNR